MNDVGKQEHKEKKAAVILAAGSGRRMNTPVAKQFLDLMGIPVFLHSVRLFDKIADKIVLVTSPDAVEYCQNLLEKEELCAEVIVIAGKSERKRCCSCAVKRYGEGGRSKWNGTVNT